MMTETNNEKAIDSNWQVATLGQLIAGDGIFTDGDWVESKDQDHSGDVRLIQLADIGDGEYKDKSSRFMNTETADALRCTFIKKGDVLVARMPEPLGRACIFPGDKKKSVTVVDVCILRPNTEYIDNKWLMYWINSPVFRNKIAALQSGTTRRRISRKNLASIEFPLPPSNLQIVIREKIEELFSHIDAGVEGLKLAKAKLQQYRQSVLKDAVTGKLTEQWRKQNADKLEPASSLLNRILDERRAKWEAEQLKAFEEKCQLPKSDKWKEKYKVVNPLTERDVAGLPLLPEGWCYAKLGQVIDDPKYGTSKKCTYEPKGKGVLRIPNIAEGEINPEDMKYAEFTGDEIATYELNEGDILTIRSNGSVTLVGKCAVISDKDTDFLFAGYLIRLRPMLKYIDAKYLKIILTSGFLRKQIEMLAKSSSGVNNINSGELQSLIIPVCDLQEQRVVAQNIDSKNISINRQFEEYDRFFKQASKNKSSILNKAFSGELVQHNSKESAKDLLKQIKAAKEKTSETKSRHPASRNKMNSKRKSLLTVLNEQSEPVKPDELMQLAGFSSNEVEEFYIELAGISEQIEQLFPEVNQIKNWPYEKGAEIKLKLKD